MSEVVERRILVVHDAGLPYRETERINQQIQAILGPMGFAVEIAADTREALERLRNENYALLIADILPVATLPHLATFTQAMAQVLDALREDPDSLVLGTLLVIRKMCDIDIVPAAAYQQINLMVMTSPFNSQELRAFVQRLLAL